MKVIAQKVWQRAGCLHRPDRHARTIGRRADRAPAHRCRRHHRHPRAIGLRARDPAVRHAHARATAVRSGPLRDRQPRHRRHGLRRPGVHRTAVAPRRHHRDRLASRTRCSRRCGRSTTSCGPPSSRCAPRMTGSKPRSPTSGASSTDELLEQISENTRETLRYARLRFLGTWLCLGLLAMLTGVADRARDRDGQDEPAADQRHRPRLVRYRRRGEEAERGHGRLPPRRAGHPRRPRRQR